MRRDRAHAVEGTDDVNLEDTTQIVCRRIDEIAKHQDTGIVHEHIDTTMTRDDGIDECRPRVFVGHVEDMRLGCSAECRCCRVHFVEDIGEDDRRAFGDEATSDRTAHAPGCTCDDGNFAAQLVHARFARAMLSATSSIMSSCPPTVFIRPISIRMSAEETPYLAAARLANSKKDE